MKRLGSLLPNCIRFSPFFYIPTAFSNKEIPLSAIIHNILFHFIFSRHTIAETSDFCQIVYFCQIVSIAMLSAASKTHTRLSPRCCDSTNGLRQKLCFFEKHSVAFDICGRSCYNKCTKGNTADRRSIQIWLITKRTRILWPRRLLFCVVYVCYQDNRSDDSRNYQNDCLAFAQNPV